MATSSVRLAWQTPEGGTEERILDKEVTTIGRDEDCDICITDTYVSRQHAKISYDGTTFLLTDAGSANGTFINHNRLESAHVLMDGDQLSIGSVIFHFEKPAPSQPPTKKTPDEITQVHLAPAINPYLEFASGSGKKIHFELLKEKITVGRAGYGQQWDLLLQDRAVSRPQAEITIQPEGTILTDKGSANGTLVNGVEISAPHVLKEGDAITFGETVLIFHAGAI